jgi:hypothetical protein
MKRNRWLWTIAFALPLAAAGAVWATSQASTYVCPVTGEELPCERCCPLNHGG